MLSEEIIVTQIFYYGYEDLDLDAIKSSMPLHAGDRFANYLEFYAAQVRIKSAVKRLTGTESTDEALVLTDGKYIAFIGLPGKSNQSFEFLPEPKQDFKIVGTLHRLYNETMEANFKYQKTGDQNEKAHYLQLRAESKKMALSISEDLVPVLTDAADPKERILAAHALGLIAHNEKQISALVHAGRDFDEAVRNNATRALGVLLQEQPSLADLVPAEHFISMLNSPFWLDRNKSIFVLLGLSKSGSPHVLQKLRKEGMASLTEMTAWPEVYACDAFTLLARIAEMSDAANAG